jgi:hypothetical protein
MRDLTDCLKTLMQSKNLLEDYGRHSELMIKDWNFEKIAVAIENKITNAVH